MLYSSSFGSENVFCLPAVARAAACAWARSTTCYIGVSNIIQTLFFMQMVNVF